MDDIEYRANAMIAQNKLRHFGILGMKWGIRRYQNKDGSLTDAGRKRYGAGEGNQKETTTSNNTPIENPYDDSNLSEHEKFTKSSQIFKDNDVVSSYTLDHGGDRERYRQAADLGLKAMGYDVSHITDNDRDWFVVEDQTIGYATVADLINKGKNANDVGTLVKMAEKMYYEWYDHIGDPDWKLPSGASELAEGYDLDIFAMQCERIKKGS